MIQTRTQFRSWIRDQFDEKNMDQDDSPIWIPEHDLNGAKCNWFVTVPCVQVSRNSEHKLDYWAWCATNLEGVVRCFWSNSDDNEEIWGFTELNDIALWLLRWM